MGYFKKKKVGGDVDWGQIIKNKEKVGQIVQGSIKHLGGGVCG